MKNTVVWASLFVMLAGVSGCGGSKSDSLIKEQIKTMNDLADVALEGKSEAKVKELLTKLQETQKKLVELKLSEADMKALGERHKDELTKAALRLARPEVQMQLLAMGDFGNMFGKGPFADPPPVTRPAEKKSKPQFEKPNSENPKNEAITNPLPKEKWKYEFYEKNYPVKVKNISYGSTPFNENYFEFTFEITEEDTKAKFPNQSLKGEIYFFDADNIVLTHIGPNQSTFATEVTGIKGEAFKYKVLLPAGFQMAKARRVEVREK